MVLVKLNAKTTSVVVTAKNKLHFLCFKSPIPDIKANIGISVLKKNDMAK